MKTLRRLLPAALCLLLGSLSSAQDTTTAPDMTAGPAPAGKPWEPGWGFWPKVPKAWQQTHEGLLKKRDKGGINVLFLGDSITAGWSGAGKELWAAKFEPMGAANFGIGGDTTRQILWRIENGGLDGLKPEVVVLMIGVNNIFTNNGTDEEIAKGVAEVVKKIWEKTPDSKILLYSVLPLKADHYDQRVKTLNPMIGELGAGKDDKITVMDITNLFRGADGKIDPELYVADGTHLSQKGYETWGESLEMDLKELMKK